jgi:hypothetical protein
LIKGHFQRRLEALLPPETPVQVIEAVTMDALRDEVGPPAPPATEPVAHGE